MMFGFKRKKLWLFYKYLVSYLIIFLIPFTTISIIFYYMSISNLREEIVRSNIAELEQVRELADSRMKELWDIATTISYDHRLTPYMLQEPYPTKIGIRELTAYQANSSFIDSLFIVYHDQKNVYSSRGTGSLENAMNNIYPFKESEKEQFRKLIKTADTPTTYPIMLDAENHHNLVSYIFPIPPNSSASHGAVVFFVRDATFINLIDNILGDFNGNAYVFNDSDEVIISKSVGNGLDIKQIKDVPVHESDVFNENINGEDYAFVTVKSQKTNWTFMTAMPTAQFYEKMSSMRTTILIMLGMIGFIGVGVTIYLSLKQYQPIQKLSHYLKQKGRGNELVNERKKNEFEEIKQKIEFIFEDSEKLRRRINKQEPFVRDQFLLELLKDNFATKPVVKELLQELQIRFTGNYFFVTIIAFNEKISAESIDHREEILKLLSEVSYKTCKGFGTELFQENAAVLIVSTDSELERTRNDFVVKLQEHLQELLLVSPTIGVGRVYEGMGLVNRSFIEAAAAIEHTRLNDKQHLIYFEDITAQTRNPLWYPVESQVQFTQSLKRGDQIVANDALKFIMIDLKEKNISPQMLRCMCFDVINTVLRVVSELSLPINVEEMHEITEFVNLDDLESKVQRLIITICNHVDKRIENHNNYLRDRILAYIQENFKRHELSLAIVAEKFELSISYLSRFIKEQTGSTFTQYVWELRSDAFKKELIESDAPIKEIVAQIGYVDVANFTRKFKKEEGLTPGQYRKRYFDDVQDEEAL